MLPLWPTDVIEKIDFIRGQIGRILEFFIVVNTETCSGVSCTLDPVTDTSTDSFCPICSGNWYIYTYSGVPVSGHIFWKSSDKLEWPSAGLTFDGECRVQIKHTGINLDLVNNSEYLMVDDKRMSIKKKAFRGVPEVNRIILYLDQEERDDE